jgi:hypothetical protein
VDPAITARDLRGDLDGDGTSDFVSIGGRSHRLFCYWCRKN